MAWEPDYVTTAELASYLRIDDSDDDIELGVAAAAASRAVDNHTHRQFGQVDSAEDRLYTAEWDRRRRRWVIEVDDFDDDDGLEITVNT
ncbi:MAG: phage gp6-like head-tail connector protein, partial [Jiangellaceae bacterium]